jgi:hypothetical protein
MRNPFLPTCIRAVLWDSIGNGADCVFIYGKSDSVRSSISAWNRHNPTRPLSCYATDARVCGGWRGEAPEQRVFYVVSSRRWS